jgi:hypothetical protein
MPGDIRDRLVRFTHYAAALREAGVLLVIFGPVSVAEIFRHVTVAAALVIWALSALLLFMGVNWDVSLERRKRQLNARGLL